MNEFLHLRPWISSSCEVRGQVGTAIQGPGRVVHRNIGGILYGPPLL